MQHFQKHLGLHVSEYTWKALIVTLSYFSKAYSSLELNYWAFVSNFTDYSAETYKPIKWFFKRLTNCIVLLSWQLQKLTKDFKSESAENNLSCILNTFVFNFQDRKRVFVNIMFSFLEMPQSEPGYLRRALCPSKKKTSLNNYARKVQNKPSLKQRK